MYTFVESLILSSSKQQYSIIANSIHSMVRVFIAVEPAAAVRQSIADAGKSLEGTARLNLVPPELMHITLKFLGDVSPGSIVKIESALDTIHASPIPLTVTRVSTFGRPPRVIKAEISDGGALARLAGQVDSLLIPLGFHPDEKPFSPHITIARIKESSPALSAALRPLQEHEFGSCIINSLVLKKSVLTPAGPIYTTLHRVSL